MNLLEVQREFSQPKPEFSPVPIWWWSGERVEKERLLWQLRQLASAGVYNVVIMNLAPSGPLYGSIGDDPPYMSEAWWELLQHTLEEAARLGVRVWFYDQLGFSGASIQAKIVAKHPEFVGRTIHRALYPVFSSGCSTLKLPPSSQDPKVLWVEGESSSGSWLPLDAELDAGDRFLIRVRVPTGIGRVAVYYTQAGGFDYLNPAAGSALIDVVHGEFERRVGQYFGKTIAGSFQDEFPGLPRWTERLPQEFLRRKGYDLVSRLGHLYDDRGPESARIRCDYWDVLASLAEESVFRPIYEWHEARGLQCGYDQWSRHGDPIESQAWYADYFKTMRWFQVPGNDHAGNTKVHSSIAHLYGRPRVWLEGFHTSGWGQTLEEIVRLIHPWYQQGATLYNPHAVYYSTYGGWWEWASPSTCFRQPYWRHYRLFADYVSRLSYLLSRGAHVCELAVLYPTASMQGELRLNGVTGRGLELREGYWNALRTINGTYLDYDLIDEESLQRAVVTESAGVPRLCIGEETYRAVLLPHVDRLHVETLARLVAFVEAGGTVACVGDPPREVASWTEDVVRFGELASRLWGEGGLAHQVSPSELAGWLKGNLPADVEWEGDPPLLSLHRRVAGRDLFFLVPDADQAALWWTQRHFSATHKAQFNTFNREWATDPGKWRRTVRLRAKGVPRQWSALSGKVYDVAYRVLPGGWTEVEVPFDEAPAALIVFHDEEEVAAISSLSPGPVSRAGASTGNGTAQRIELAGPWRVELEPTAENRWGDFRFPASPGSPPVEVRKFLFRVEPEGASGVSLGWHLPDIDEAGWRPVLYSYGPRWWYIGPFGETGTFEDFSCTYAPELFPFDPQAVYRGSGWRDVKWELYRYSERYGIEKDSIHQGAQGAKGRVPQEFIDLGATPPWQVYYLYTSVYSRSARSCRLRIGAAALKAAWVNGRRVLEQDRPGPYVQACTVQLAAGFNTVLVKVARQSDHVGFGHGRLRLSVDLRAQEEQEEDESGVEWIWGPGETPATGRRWFWKRLMVDGSCVGARVSVAADCSYVLYVNGALVGEQGNFDTYFMSRGERYDILPYLRSGENLIALRCVDQGHPAALLLDGELAYRDGSCTRFATDGSWMYGTAPPWEESSSGGDLQLQPALVVAGPQREFWGDRSVLLLRSQSHALAETGWLQPEHQELPKRERLFRFDPFSGERVTGWYRFILPPGARTMRMQVRGRASVFVGGRRVAEGLEGEVEVALPEEDAPSRVCAIRVESAPGYYEGDVFPVPLEFEMGPGSMELGWWNERGLPHYSGGIRYVRDVTLQKIPSEVVLDLGRVRGTAEVWCNGRRVDIRLWSPFRFLLTPYLRQGDNRLEVLVFNTLGPHYGDANPSPFVYAGQDKTGLAGPVVLEWRE